MTEELTCRDVADFLAGYVTDDLRPDVRVAFEAHLAVCPECVAYLASYRSTIHLTKRALGRPADEAPADVPDPLVRAILAARGRPR